MIGRWHPRVELVPEMKYPQENFFYFFSTNPTQVETRYHTTYSYT